MSDPYFSKVWKVRSAVFRSLDGETSVFQGLEGQVFSFPKFGWSDPQFSKVWKVKHDVFERVLTKNAKESR